MLLYDPKWHIPKSSSSSKFIEAAAAASWEKLPSFEAEAE